MKPWTRWWWMGSAVDEEDLSRLLEEYASKGFGGVEIAPIYGAKGYEDRYVEYLSPRWVELLNHTVAEADSLGMGVDMTTGTGWPFGGPTITPEFAASKLVIRQYDLMDGHAVDGPVQMTGAGENSEAAEIVAATAYGPDRQVVDVSGRIDGNGNLDWRPAEGKWTVYVAFAAPTGQTVKRAAPGGEGYTFDHLSREATRHYLTRFDHAFGRDVPDIRHFFNDSYEVYGASWSRHFMEAFEQRRGYSLSNHLRALNGDGDEDIVSRVKSDYRETMSEVLIDHFSTTWTEWANDKSVRTRSQAHGSPANLLDVYASVDTPEIETFGATHFDIPGLFWDRGFVKEADHNELFLKLAASAANLTGKKLVSSETFTWLGEHFRVPLSQAKPEAEQAWLSGVNHIFYHGTTYSPDDADWPGWLFYASVNFSPTNSFWTHIGGMNEYVARVQSILQTTTADNDVLVYWPIYDTWHDAEGLEKMMAVHGSEEWLHYPAVKNLLERGYSFDFVSDSLLETLMVEKSRLVVPGGESRYKAVVVPKARFMPVATLERLKRLSESGLPVIFEALPEDVPGLPNLEERRSRMAAILSSSKHFRVTDDLDSALSSAGIRRETVVDTGLKFVRKTSSRGSYYFLVNHSSSVVDRYIEVNRKGAGVLLQDPQTGGFGTVPATSTGSGTRFRVQMEPGESLFARVTNDRLANIEEWKYEVKAGEPVTLEGEWQLAFVRGGPELPDPVVLNDLRPWTRIGSETMNRFSGTARYSTEFRYEKKTADDYILDLGRVYHSARVTLNGRDLGVLWSVPYRVNIGPYLTEGRNRLVIEVANLMANRIRDLDQRGVVWNVFHDINMVNINYRAFDASGWEVMPSGLEGPVTIRPVDHSQSTSR